MNPNLKRTIIHEIGHFVAIELNNLLFESGECLSIQLNAETVNGENDFRGLTKSDVNNDKDEKTKWNLLSQRIAVLVYGCFFQCLFEEKELNDCFGFNNSSLNGATDRQMYNTVFPFEVEREQRRETEKYLNEYLNSLNLSRKDFEIVFNQNFTEIINTEENLIEVNLKNLKENLDEFLKSHLEVFKEFHEKITSIKTKK